MPVFAPGLLPPVIGAPLLPFGPYARPSLLPQVLPPPPPAVTAGELAAVRQIANHYRTPYGNAWAEYLDKEGGLGIWRRYAKEYRSVAGFGRGWVGTGVLAATLAVTALKTQKAKKHYARPRPYQSDSSIKLIGRAPHDASYPSGHTSSAFAAATVMSALWPARAAEYHAMARLVGFSRIYAGAHHPSDVVVGARLGSSIAHGLLSRLV